jgi:DNA-binding response OmpR family regulator
MSGPSRWRGLLDAFEDALEGERLDGRPTADADRLTALILARASLEGHLELADACTARDRSRILASLRRVVWRPVHRQGVVALCLAADAADALHAALAGLEHRVLPVALDQIPDLLDEGHLAAIVAHVGGPEVLDLLAELQLDPRGRKVPVVALVPPGAPRAQAAGLGAAAVLREPVEVPSAAAAVATLLAQDPAERLPDRAAFTATYADVRADARRDGTGFAVLVAQPSNLANARRTHGAPFGRVLLEAGVEAIRQHLGDRTRLHALDDETLAWVSRAPRDALYSRLAEITSGPGRAIRTPEGTPWYNRLAIAGVEVVDLPLEQAIQGARRMLLLARRAGGSEPVLTVLEPARGTLPRALVLEPDAARAEVLHRAIARAGLEAVRADGDPAIAARTAPFAVALVGVRGAPGLRALEALAEAGVEVIAAVDGPGTARTALHHGASDVVVDPVDPLLLAARLEARIRGRRAPTAS